MEKCYGTILTPDLEYVKYLIYLHECLKSLALSTYLSVSVYQKYLDQSIHLCIYSISIIYISIYLSTVARFSIYLSPSFYCSLSRCVRGAMYVGLQHRNL